MADTSYSNFDHPCGQVNCDFSVSAKTSAFSFEPYKSSCCPSIGCLSGFLFVSGLQVLKRLRSFGFILPRMQFHYFSLCFLSIVFTFSLWLL